MATIFYDGFDYYTTADLPKNWNSPGVGLTIGSLYARAPSGQGCNWSGNNSTPLTKTFGSNYISGCVGFGFFFTNSAASRSALLTIQDGGTEQISVRTNGSGVLVVNRGATLLATGTTVLSASTWYYIELKFSINATTGTVLMQLNGVAETLTYVTGTSTTQNTKATANVQWNGVVFGVANQASSAAQYDDIYVLDTATGSNTTFLGPVRCVALYPAAAGNYSQWTANGGTNMGCVSEPYEDGDNSFNQSATANQIDSFVMGDLPAGAGSVFSVKHVITARQDSGAGRTMAPLTRISGSDYVGTTVSLSTSYQFLQQIYDLQPVGGTPAWDVATVNALEAGYKLIS